MGGWSDGAMTHVCIRFGLLAASVLVVSVALSSQGAAARGDPPGPSTSPGTPPVPRVSPVPRAQWTLDQRAVVTRHDKEGDVNELATLLHHPELADSLMAVVQYFAEASTLTPREREILILRTAWLCRS